MSKTKDGTELPIIPFATPQAWADWLDENGSEAAGIWIKLAKKDSGVPSITYHEALEEALRYGWIDGHKKGLDEMYWLQRFTPRRPNSKWSQVNREKAERLIADGRMQPAGLAEVTKAKDNGQWDAAYESQSKATVPDDLQAELDASPKAAEFFSTLNSVNRYAILYRIQTAKKPETRQKRIRQFVDMLEKGETVYPT